MTDTILSKKYIDIAIANTDSDLKNVDYTVEHSSAIVADQSQYDLNIIRFKLPSGAIPKYRLFAGSEDHIIYMCKSNETPIAVDLTGDLLGQSKLELYNSGQMLDIINRGLMKCYGTYQRSLLDPYPGVYSVGFTAAFNQTQTTSDPANISGNPIGTSAVYLRLKINDVLYTNPTVPKNLRMYLSNGTSTVMLLNLPKMSSLKDLIGVTFEDGGYYSTSSDFSLPGMKTRYPFEPMFKIYPNVVLADWTVSVYCDDPTWSCSFEFELSIAPIDIDNKVPMYAPYFSVDNATNLLTLNYSPAWYNSSIKIGFSKTLRTLLDNFDYNQINGIDYLQLPQQIAVTTFNTADNANTIQLRQLTSSLYLFNQVNRLSFTTNISVEAEKTESVGGTSTVLTDFLPDPAGTPDYYIYTPATDFRRYRLLSHAPLRRVSMSAYVEYIDGEREIVKIRRGETASLKMMLTPVGSY